jgi:hypothetical protein
MLYVCITGYCFCVDEETGMMVSTTAVLKRDFHCNARISSPSNSPRSIEKCPDERKRRFITEFKALMTAKVDFSGWGG